MTGRRRHIDVGALPRPASVRRELLRDLLVEDVREGQVLADVLDADQRDHAAKALGEWVDRAADSMAFAEHLIYGLQLDAEQVVLVVEFAELLKLKASTR